MASTINAISTGPGGIATTADATGILHLQTNGTTAVSVSAEQVVTLTNALPIASGGTGLIAAGELNNVLTSNGTAWESKTPTVFNLNTAVTPGTNGNVLTSNGTAWESTALSGSNITTGIVAAARLDLTALSGSNITTGTVAAARLGIAGSVVGTTDSQTLTGKTITGLKETKVAIAASDVDISLGNYFTKTCVASSTLTVSNVPATGTVASFVIDLTNGGTYAITWWSGMKWAAGLAPTLTSSGRDILGFFTHDAGTTWNGLVLAKDIK